MYVSTLPHAVGRSATWTRGAGSQFAVAGRAAEPKPRTGRRLIAAAVFLAALTAAGNEGDVADGLASFREGRFAEAFQAWWHAAAAGDARGDLYLGVMYDIGQGVTQNYTQAMTWYRKAAEAGSASGAFNVGVFYDAGLGVPKDAAQAARWYARAATGQSGRAEYNLAMLYETGTGVAKDRKRAIGLYRDAAVHQITAARAHLAALGQPFIGQPLAGESIPAPDTDLQAILQAQNLILGRSPTELARAAELFRRSAEHGNALAQYDLGYCYEYGMGVKRDNAQASAWYRRAAMSTADDMLRALARAGADYLDQGIHPAEPDPSGATRPG